MNRRVWLSPVDIEEVRVEPIKELKIENPVLTEELPPCAELEMFVFICEMVEDEAIPLDSVRVSKK